MTDSFASQVFRDSSNLPWLKACETTPTAKRSSACTKLLMLKPSKSAHLSGTLSGWKRERTHGRQAKGRATADHATVIAFRLVSASCPAPIKKGAAIQRADQSCQITEALHDNCWKLHLGLFLVSGPSAVGSQGSGTTGTRHSQAFERFLETNSELCRSLGAASGPRVLKSSVCPGHRPSLNPKQNKSPRWRRPARLPLRLFSAPGPCLSPGQAWDLKLRVQGRVSCKEPSSWTARSACRFRRKKAWDIDAAQPTRTTVLRLSSGHGASLLSGHLQLQRSKNGNIRNFRPALLHAPFHKLLLSRCSSAPPAQASTQPRDDHSYHFLCWAFSQVSFKARLDRRAWGLFKISWKLGG